MPRNNASRRFPLTCLLVVERRLVPSRSSHRCDTSETATAVKEKRDGPKMARRV